MNYEQYLKQRQELSDKAQTLINEGKTEAAPENRRCRIFR